MASSIPLAPEAEARLDRLAKATGRTKAFYLRELIEQGLDDLEEAYMAAEVLERIRRGEERTHSSQEVRATLGLDG